MTWVSPRSNADAGSWVDGGELADRAVGQRSDGEQGRVVADCARRLGSPDPDQAARQPQDESEGNGECRDDHPDPAGETDRRLLL